MKDVLVVIGIGGIGRAIVRRQGGLTSRTVQLQPLLFTEDAANGAVTRANSLD